MPSTWTAPLEMSQMHYLPLAPGFFDILVGFFFIVLMLRSVRYAYPLRFAVVYREACKLNRSRSIWACTAESSPAVDAG